MAGSAHRKIGLEGPGEAQQGMRLSLAPWALALLLVALVQACAGGQATQRPDRAPQAAPEPEPTPEPSPAAGGADATVSGDAVGAAGGVPPPLPAKVDGGQIPRQELKAVLDAGVARFLQRIQTEPHLEHGRFVGWRLLSTYPREDALTPAVLAPGDTVMRVNGQSIERPEQFKNVWDAMATSSELVLEVRRGDHDSTVRYLIVD